MDLHDDDKGMTVSRSNFDEVVAIEYQHEETGLIGFVDVWSVEQGFFVNNPRLQEIGPLYRHPPARQEEIATLTLEVERLTGENGRLRDALVIAHKQSFMVLRSFDEYVAWLMKGPGD